MSLDRRREYCCCPSLPDSDRSRLPILERQGLCRELLRWDEAAFEGAAESIES